MLGGIRTTRLVLELTMGPAARKMSSSTVKKTPPSLRPALQNQLDIFRGARAFNPEIWVRHKTLKFLNYLQQCGLRGAVVNVSGGVDSAVVLGLCCYAQKTSPAILKRVVGIAQPIHSTKAIQDRAYAVAAAFNAEIITVDQSDLHTTLHHRIEDALSIKGSADASKTDALGFSRGQLRSYMRTPVAYYVAQLLSSHERIPSIVMGTGNYDEDGYLYYFCKAGDGVVDVQLISDLHKSEVRSVGKYLGVPNSILEAPPSADLWEGQTDETELGITYDFIELYTEFLKSATEARRKVEKSFTGPDKEQWDALKSLAENTHKRNAHKSSFPVNL